MLHTKAYCVHTKMQHILRHEHLVHRHMHTALRSSLILLYALTIDQLCYSILFILLFCCDVTKVLPSPPGSSVRNLMLKYGLILRLKSSLHFEWQICQEGKQTEGRQIVGGGVQYGKGAGARKDEK